MKALSNGSSQHKEVMQPSIAYVDDSPTDLQHVEREFIREGIECDYFEIPPERYDCDILIIDHNLNGHTTGPKEVARAIADNPGVAIVVYSGEDRLSILNEYPKGSKVFGCAKQGDGVEMLLSIVDSLIWLLRPR